MLILQLCQHAKPTQQSANGLLHAKTFTPDFVEGLDHVQQNGSRSRSYVSGVRQMRNNADELKSDRVLSAKLELFVADNIIQ